MHVTPKSYLNFIGGYKNIYQQKKKELGEGAERMDTGLAKLDEASESVESLKKDLAVMDKHCCWHLRKQKGYDIYVDLLCNYSSENNQIT